MDFEIIVLRVVLVLNVCAMISFVISAFFLSDFWLGMTGISVLLMYLVLLGGLLAMCVF